MSSIFKMLLDTTNDVAHAITKINIGQAINGAVNGMAVFGFRDSSGNATMPQLNDEGAMAVVFDAGTLITIPHGKKTKAEMESAGQGVRVTLGEVALIEGRTYTCPDTKLSAARETLFELVMVEDIGGSPIETIIDATELQAGTSAFTGSSKDKFMTDANVDTKKLFLYATMLENKGSDVYGKASANLVAAN